MQSPCHPPPLGALRPCGIVSHRKSLQLSPSKRIVCPSAQPATPPNAPTNGDHPMTNLSQLSREQLEALVTKMQAAPPRKITFKVTAPKADPKSGEMKGS